MYNIILCFLQERGR